MPKQKPKTVVFKRGVPEKVYALCKRLVRAGKTSWTELEAAGIVQPRKRRTAPETEQLLGKLQEFRKNGRTDGGRTAKGKR